ncbi:MAG: MBL fold metallo-hydrolase, partial [Solirubrobacterales bacterium]|nr:MBL fold metallo-hydrolase [Solirubrobacterales bacterium]
MRVVSLHHDVLVVTSRIWQTTCTIVRSGEECFVIDSPILPDELEVLPTVIDHAGYSFSGLLATHADWDHMLARLAFGQAALGVAETTAARLAAEPGAVARDLRDFDDEHYIDRDAPLSLGQV